MMFFGTDKKGESTGKSDFNEFWQVLEDLEQNGDHVAIGKIVLYFNSSLYKCKIIFRFFSYTAK